MRKAILLYNPLAGRRRSRRLADVERVLAILRAGGVEVSAAPTRAGAQTTEQALQAIDTGCDSVIACGGDGTVHDVLQGLVGTNVSLGISPLGTANSLAHDLRLPLSPARAAEAALTAKARRIAVGRVVYRDFSGNPAARHFVVTAGIGVDAQLFYALNPLAKRQLGIAAYYAYATHLWLMHRMEWFTAEIRSEEGQPPRRYDVTQLLAVRIADFGGALRTLAPGASLDRDDLRLVLFQTCSRTAYLRYVLRGLFRASWNIRGIELQHECRVLCRPKEVKEDQGSKSKIYVEADGELLGTLPAEISVVPDALTVLGG